MITPVDNVFAVSSIATGLCLRKAGVLINSFLYNSIKKSKRKMVLHL